MRIKLLQKNQKPITQGCDAAKISQRKPWRGLCVSASLRAILLVSAVVQTTGCQSTSDLGQKQFDPSTSDPKAVRIADEVMVALGGRENFEAINYLSFHFVSVADTKKVSDWRHDWDRRSNNYRLEGVTREGDHLLAFFNLDTQDGTAFKNGQKMEGEEKLQILKLAYRRYINDTYWLLMPFKLKDAGAVLKYDGVQELNDIAYDVLRLSFADSVGLTPRNIYRVFIDPATRIVHRWEYFAQEGGDPSPAWWEKWNIYGGIKFSEQRSFDNSNRKLLLTNIVASRQVDEKIFEAPSTSTAGVF
jgi:hypothetical protein